MKLEKGHIAALICIPLVGLGYAATQQAETKRREAVSASYTAVSIGTSSADVVSAMGEPSERSESQTAHGSIETWTYPGVVVTIQDGNVSRIDRP